MKKQLLHALRFAPGLVGAALLLPLLSLTPAAQCGDDFYVNGADAYQYYGYSMAIDGDWAVVGLPGHAGSVGAVDVLTRIDGEWRMHQRITTPNTVGAAQFGCAVDISGDTAAIGAWFDTPAGSYKQGCAFVFELQGNRWVETARLEASDADSYDEFGCSIAIDGDLIAVGAHKDEATGGNYSGSVYIFERNTGVWTEEQKVQPTGVASSWYFGRSVDLDGTSLVAGTQTQYGSAHVFVKYGNNWIQQASLTDPYGASNSQFAVDVAIKGDLVAVGQPSVTNPTYAIHSGVVHTFLRSGAIWSAGSVIEPADGVYNDYFGKSVDFVDGTTIAIGAYYDDYAATDAGALYVFEESGGIWSEAAQIAQCQASGYDGMGWRLAASADTIFVGAYADDDMGADAGKVLVAEEMGGSWMATDELWGGAALSLAAGGNASLELDFGVGSAGRMFFVVGTTSGTTPGFTVLGQHIPLNYDAYTALTATAPNSPPLTNSFGFTDASGLGTCTFTVPAGTDPILAGLKVTHCAALIFPLNYVTKTDDLVLID